MKLLYVLRFLINHIFRDWLRSILTILSLSMIAFIFFLSSALISDMGNFGNGLIDVPQTLIFMSRNAMMPSDSQITIAAFDSYQKTVRSQFGEQSIKQSYTKIFRQLHYDGRSISLSTLTQDEMQDDSDFFLLEGSWPNKEQEIVVTKAFNTITEKSIGDTMTIYGSEFLISGIVSSEKWTAAVIFMPVTQAEKLYQTQGVFQLGFIQLNNTVDANLVQQFLETNLNEGDCCSVYQDDHFVALYRDAVKGIRFLARILQLIVLFLIAFGSYNASALVLNEHEREIALLHVVGFSTKVINGILMIRLWILLFISYFVGYVSALIYSKWYLSNLRLAISGNLIRLQITWNSFLLGAGLIFLFAVIGVWFSLRHQYTNNINTSLQKVFTGRVG